MAKFCPRCERDKEDSEFVPNSHRHDGLSGYCRECVNGYQRDREARLRAAVLALYGEICGGCGITDARVLTVDHRAGGGRQDRLGGNRQAKFYLHVLANPELYQLLCFNCNWIKHLEGEAFATPFVESPA